MVIFRSTSFFLNNQNPSMISPKALFFCLLSSVMIKVNALTSIGLCENFVFRRLMTVNAGQFRSIEFKLGTFVFQKSMQPGQVYYPKVLLSKTDTQAIVDSPANGILTTPKGTKGFQITLTTTKVSSEVMYDDFKVTFDCYLIDENRLRNFLTSLPATDPFRAKLQNLIGLDAGLTYMALSGTSHGSEFRKLAVTKQLIFKCTHSHNAQLCELNPVKMTWINWAKNHCIANANLNLCGHGVCVNSKCYTAYINQQCYMGRCAQGLWCINSKCYKPPIEGQSCLSGKCGAGLGCLNGVCRNCQQGSMNICQ